MTNNELQINIKSQSSKFWSLVLVIYLVLGFWFLGSPNSASAVTRNVPCSGDILNALNSAINASVTGDIITIGPGNCSLSTKATTVKDKNIQIIGAGIGVTNIVAENGFVDFESTGANQPQWRLSGMSLSGSGHVIVTTVWANQDASWRGPFRIDHLDINYPNASPDGIIAIYGPVWGLIDHNNFKQWVEAFILTGGWVSSESPSSVTTTPGSWLLSQPFRPGAADYLYIENNTFEGLGPTGAAALDTGYTGGRVVFRNNTLINSALYAHWTSAGSINTLWWEIYNNKFTYNKEIVVPVMRLHGGGTGLIYNNTMIGYGDSNVVVLGEGRFTEQGQSSAPLLFCDGTHNWDGNAGDPNAPGWPCIAQTGRAAGKTVAQIQAGQKEGSFPLYIWNNGTQDKCYNPSAAGSVCDNSFHVSVAGAYALPYFKNTPHVTSGYGNGDVDYSITTSKPTGAGTHTLNYTPFQYPYPLTANGMPNPSGSGSSSPVVGDINLDHIVNSIDYSILNSDWFTSNSRSDLNHDGLVNAIDYSLLNANWFRTW